MYRQDECEFWMYGRDAYVNTYRKNECKMCMYGKDAFECIESNIVLCACIERMHANVLNRKDECALCLYGKNPCVCIKMCTVNSSEG